MHWKIDECPDANGNWTLREADGTEHGNTETCIATVYGGILEQELIETAPRLKEECDRLQEQVKLLREAAAKVLDANCGDPWGLLDEGDQPRDGLDALKVALEATKEGA